MNVRLKNVLALFLAAVAVAGAPLCAAMAQGFASVSSLTPASEAARSLQPAPGEAGATTRASVPPDATAPAAGHAPPDPPQVAVTPAVTERIPEPGVQTLAALGFSSVSSGVPSLPSPTTPFGSGPSTTGSGASWLADAVLVDKSDRRLYLMSRGRVIAEYPVKLGLNPYGPKQREGDFRTPEGRYTLVRRNPESEFFLSIQVSYPNREESAVAKEAGFEPGGLIMIHGQPNVPKRPAEFYATRDWTDGCIALSNADMIDVWRRTTLGIPIEIRP